MRLLYLPKEKGNRNGEYTKFVLCQGYDPGQPLETDHGICFAHAAG